MKAALRIVEENPRTLVGVLPVRRHGVDMYDVNGTVARKLRGVKSGINR